MARLLLLCALASLLPRVADAGAWTKEFGELYAKLGVDAYAGLTVVDPLTGERLDANFFGLSPSLYAEVGVLPELPLMVSVHVPYTVSVRSVRDDELFVQGAATALTSRPGDLQLGLQTTLLPPRVRQRLQLSVGGVVKIPMYPNSKVGQSFGAWAPLFALPGDGQVDLTAWLRAGGGFSGKVDGWVEGGLGYRHRTEAFVDWEPSLEFSDGLPADFTLGFDLGKLLLMAKVDAVIPLKDDAVTRRFVSVGAQAMVRLPRGFFFEARVAGEPWAVAASQGIGFGVGLSWQGDLRKLGHG